MSDIDIRRTGAMGHITLNRPQALNALTYEMATRIEAALDAWRDDPQVACVLIDAAGDKAFCAGGDLAQMYATATAGDFEYGRHFWRDEYRLNAKIADFPKPYVALMQGFTMGGGVGVSCHGSHRVVGASSQIAMPECGVGLVPDVGGSYLLARAPGRLGEFLGTTATRMGPGDAIHAGFADVYIPQDHWADLRTRLADTGDITAVTDLAQTPPDAPLARDQARIDADFAGETAADIWRGLNAAWADDIRKKLSRNCPLSVAATVELVHRVRGFHRIQPALEMEYRFTARSASEGEFIEGIRAAIVDKDRNPQWQHASVLDVPSHRVSAMLAPLGADALKLD